MKIILARNGMNSKVFLDDGQDITKDLYVSEISVFSEAGEPTIAFLTVFPSEVVVEVDEGNLEFRKHSNWENFKASAPRGKWVLQPFTVTGDDFGRGI